MEDTLESMREANEDFKEIDDVIRTEVDITAEGVANDDELQKELEALIKEGEEEAAVAAAEKVRADGEKVRVRGDEADEIAGDGVETENGAAEKNVSEAREEEATRLLELQSAPSALLAPSAVSKDVSQKDRKPEVELDG